MAGNTGFDVEILAILDKLMSTGGISKERAVQVSASRVTTRHTAPGRDSQPTEATTGWMMDFIHLYIWTPRNNMKLH